MDKKLKTIFEVRKSAALRMWDAENKQRAKSDASNKRTPSSIPVPAKSAPSQGVAEAKDDYVPPREANYDDKYQAMVRRVGEKARAQEKARQQQPPKAPVRENRLALLKQIIQS